VVWPWLILFVPARRLTGMLYGVVVGAPLFRVFAYVVFPDSPLRGLPLGSFDLLATGGLLAYAKWKRDDSTAKTRVGPSCLMAAISVVVFFSISFRTETHMHATSPFLNSCAAVFLTWVSAKATVGFRGFTGKLLQNSLIVYLGKISYGIYIFHGFMGTVLVKLSYALPLFLYVRQNRFLRFVFLYVLTVCVACASWELLERPINNLKRKFPYERAETETGEPRSTDKSLVPPARPV